MRATMRRPYISGPMTGYTHHNLPAFFDVEEKLRSRGYEPLNPARNHGDTWEAAYQYGVDNPQTWEAYIRQDLRMVLDADGIILLEGWERSKGACLELVTAVCVGNPMMKYFPDWYAPGDWMLIPIDVEMAYSKAIAHLDRCMLGGVALTDDGHAKYV